MSRRTVTALALWFVGVVLVANPLYLDVIYLQGDGFDLSALFYAALSTLGFLALALSVFTASRRSALTVPSAAALAVAAVALVFVSNRLSEPLFRAAFDPAVAREYLYPVSYPGGEGLLVEFTIAMLLPLGVAARDGDRRGAALVALGVLAFTAFVVESGGIPAVAGVLFLGASPSLLGIPGLGLALVLAPLALGYYYDSLTAERSVV